MFRAHVPEATVDEDCDPRPCEHDVRGTGQVTAVHREPHSSTMDFATQLKLGPGVGSGHPLHLLRDHRVEWRRLTPSFSPVVGHDQNLVVRLSDRDLMRKYTGG